MTEENERNHTHASLGVRKEAIRKLRILAAVAGVSMSELVSRWAEEEFAASGIKLPKEAK